jgi:hypothetical protein
VVAEKRRAKVDEVNAIHFHAFEDFDIVTEDEAVYFYNKTIGILLLAERVAAVKAARVFSLLPERDYARFCRYFHFCPLATSLKAVVLYDSS